MLIRKKGKVNDVMLWVIIVYKKYEVVEITSHLKYYVIINFDNAIEQTH